MKLAEESEHQRMGIFPSKAKVTAQSPRQTMEVFIEVVHLPCWMFARA